LEHNSEYSNILLFIIGNKSDLNGERKVSVQEAIKFAEEQNAKYFETSGIFLNFKNKILNFFKALNGRGIETAMQGIAESILIEVLFNFLNKSFGKSINLPESAKIFADKI